MPRTLVPRMRDVALSFLDSSTMPFSRELLRPTLSSIRICASREHTWEPKGKRKKNGKLSR